MVPSGLRQALLQALRLRDSQPARFRSSRAPSDQLMTMLGILFLPCFAMALKSELQSLENPMMLHLPRVKSGISGSTILCHRYLTQRSRRTPCGGIVDIDIGHETLFQAIHKAIIRRSPFRRDHLFCGPFLQFSSRAGALIFHETHRWSANPPALGRRRRFAAGNRRKHPLCPRSS